MDWELRGKIISNTLFIAEYFSSLIGFANHDVCNLFIRQVATLSGTVGDYYSGLEHESETHTKTWDVLGYLLVLADAIQHCLNYPEQQTHMIAEILKTISSLHQTILLREYVEADS